MVSEVEVLKGRGAVKSLCSVFLFNLMTSSSKYVLNFCCLNIWYFLICMYRKYRHSWFYFNIVLCCILSEIFIANVSYRSCCYLPPSSMHHLDLLKYGQLNLTRNCLA